MIPPPPRPTLFPYTTLFRSLAVELHQNITGFEACFSRWTTIAHVGKFNATVLHLPEIRDRTEIRTISATSAHYGRNWLGHAHELRFVVQCVQTVDHIPHKFNHTCAVHGVDLVPGV